LKHFISTILSILNRNEKVRMCKHILLDLVIGMLDIAFLGFLLLVINFYTTNPGSGNLFLFKYLADKNPLFIISLFFLLFSLKNWLAYLVSRSQNIFFYGIASRLSKRNIWHYLQGDYTKFINTDSSVYIRKISQQPIEFSNYILTNIQQVISQSILIFFTIIGILFYHPKLFLSLFILLLPPVIVLAFFIKKKLKSVRASIKVTSQMSIQHLQESLSGYVESNIYRKNGFFTDRFHRYQQQLNDNIATQQSLQILPSRLIEVFAVLGFFILFAVNKLSAGAPAIDLLTIGVFMAAAYKIIPGIIKILNCTGQIKTYQFTLDDLSLPGNQASEPAEDKPVHPINSLKFEKVYFDYHGHNILSNVSFKLAPGDFVGISADSGKGKTTIINLLLGFLEPRRGTIYLNNKVTDGIERQRYWNKISYVKQQPFFIHDSILKNITLADDSYDRDKLREVISFCGIDQLLDKYPEGLEKTIKENGKNISGGQRQRIMLARALYHDFDLLILDEPFGEIDDSSEKALLIQLQGLAQKGKMILFITHNKTSLSFCNKIFSLDEEYA
jgi:ABC-type multidrug transport system fused ATPase/permease subunit